MVRILNTELEIVKQRLKRVGYTLYTYEEALEALISDTEYIDEEIEIFIFEAGETYRFIESAITMRRDNDIEAIHKDIESNINHSTQYKRKTAWRKKLYDYAKLNNFAYTFVISDNK